MSASISTKESSIAVKALGASARTIKGGMISFISSAMPESTSALSQLFAYSLNQSYYLMRQFEPRLIGLNSQQQLSKFYLHSFHFH